MSEEQGQALAFISLVAVAIFGFVKCGGPERLAEVEKDRAAQELALQTPHKIRSTDGCDVYEFKSDGYWHYFTRCAAMTTTERNYTAPCGKNQRCARKEEITTENLK